MAILHQDPHQFGLAQSRWTLAAVRQGVAELASYSISGIWRLLTRLGIRWKRGRHTLTSPDPHYAAKCAWVTELLAAAAQAPDQIVALYQDELTFYRQPTVANAYARVGPDQPRARRSYRADTRTRVAATLDPHQGRVLASGGQRHLGVAALVDFYQQVCAAYPQAEQIYVIQDNWPVHFHADLLVALQPQRQPFPWPHPQRWPITPSPAAQRRWGDLALPIQLVPLPTYAPWTNPIEKLWRWLKQQVLHLHRWADDLPTLRARVDAFLARFANGSDDLLRYTGLLVPD